jgi:hypothetical protein
MDIPNWASLLIASGAGLVTGVLITASFGCHIAINGANGVRILPRWAVVSGALGAGMAIILSTLLAIKMPGIISLSVAILIIIFFGISGIGTARAYGK